MVFESVHTRFRAYQLSTAGSSFSYWDVKSNQFTLGEARLTDDNYASILHELDQCGKNEIDLLYISSWDRDHCNSSELEQILSAFKPSSILYPGYEPDQTKENQVLSSKLIKKYQGPPTPIKYQGNYSGPQSSPWAYSNFTYKHAIDNYEKANDKSVIHMWRSGNISILSVGDLESSQLSEELASNSFLKEVDILLLPHHGSSPEFTTSTFLKALSPKVCIALVDRQNQYNHPDDNVYQRVNEHSWYHSTKEGDVIVETYGGHHDCFQVYDYSSNGEVLSKVRSFKCKKKVNFENFFR